MKRITKNRLVCETTKNGIITKDTLFRAEGFTSNGYWMIKDEYQGKIARAIPTVLGEQPPIKKVIPTLDDITKLVFIDTLDTRELDGNTYTDPTTLFEREVDGEKVLVNGYFYHYLFDVGMELYQVKGDPMYRFNALKPVIIAKDDEAIGLIMPLKIK